MINTLIIAVEPSPETNDHQARLLIDGQDWLGQEVLGLDPGMLETELLTTALGALTVGRCGCGVVGCDDLKVEMTRTETLVHWSAPGGRNLCFDAVQYDRELDRFAQDKSWETMGRRVEREVEQIFRGTATENGFAFDWASTLIQEGLVQLSFSKGGEQKLLEFSWDAVNSASARERARAFRAERFALSD